MNLEPMIVGGLLNDHQPIYPNITLENVLDLRASNCSTTGSNDFHLLSFHRVTE